jgi:hypothetical protein
MKNPKVHTLLLGNIYWISFGNNKYFPVKFIKVTKCGYNFLNEKTNKCVLPLHLYMSKFHLEKLGRSNVFKIFNKFLIIQK